MQSIRASKIGNVYQVDKRSDSEAVKSFAIITREKFTGLSITRDPVAPDGDTQLCARVMKTLVDHYPGYVWMVEVDDRGTVGMVNIYNQNVNAELFANAPYGYQLHLSRVASDPGLHCVVMAAGEILERANIARGRARGEQIKQVEGVKQQHQPLIVTPSEN